MAYQDGETRVVNGVTYQRQGGVWRKQGALDQSGNPIRFRGVQTPKGAANTVEAQNNAAASIYAPRQAEVGIENTQSTIADRAQDNSREETRLDADLLSKGLRRGPNGVEKIPGWQPPSPAKDQGRIDRLNAAAAQLRRVQSLYNTGVGKTKGVFGALDYLPTPANKQFDTAGAGLAEAGLAAFRIPGVGSQSDRELQAFVEANKPSSSDYDAQIEEKLRNLDSRLGQAYAGAGVPYTSIFKQKPSLKNAPRKGGGWKIERIGD